MAVLAILGVGDQIPACQHLFSPTVASHLLTVALWSS